jgi:hypothetical protein
VLCGHIHSAAIREFDNVTYYNCGDWVESCTALVEGDDGFLSMLNYHPLSASWPAANGPINPLQREDNLPADQSLKGMQ